MKRAWSILLSVLLGAVVVGIGTGYFLHLANKDRQLLALEADQAKADAIRAQQEQQNAIEQANEKLKQASDEVNKAQGAIKALQLERTLLAQAKPLTPPNSRSIQDWPSAISTFQNISLRYPLGSTVKQDDEQILALTASSTSAAASQVTDGPWFRVTPFDQMAKNQLLARFTSSTHVTYFVNGHLLDGQEGDLLTDGSTLSQAAVLDLYQDSTTSQLVWIQTPPNQHAGKKSRIATLEDVLSTLEFPKQP